MTWARHDTTDAAGPRIDAFASLLSLDGAAHKLVDVNDPSAGRQPPAGAAPRRHHVPRHDDERRGGGFTAPDGVVDMRDFRRFRDAWLQQCQTDPEVGCPATISLDGAPDHPKRDLNLDGCVHAGSDDDGCPTPEATDARVDFNGDGEISPRRPSWCR